MKKLRKAVVATYFIALGAKYNLPSKVVAKLTEIYTEG